MSEPNLDELERHLDTAKRHRLASITVETETVSALLATVRELVRHPLARDRPAAGGARCRLTS